MSIFTRTRDIVAANFADLLDKAEDPGKMIRMIIMEMEETLVEVSGSAARAIAEQKDMRRQIGKLERLQQSWAERAEFALSKGRDDLAKGALTEKSRAADLAEQFETEIALLDDGLRASEADVDRLQARLREARTRQNAISSRLESAHDRVRMLEARAGSKVDEAVSRYELLDRRPDALPPMPALSLEDEIAGLRHADLVEAELAAMKAARDANKS